MTFAVFYFCFDALFQKLNRGDERTSNSAIPQRYAKASKTLLPEVERFVHEEFDSPNHDVVVLVVSSHDRCVGIAVFLQECKVEYFVESFPACCLKEGDLKTRAGLTAVSYWGVKCTMASNATLLVDDRPFVASANSKGSLVADKLAVYENQYDFKLACQWIDNFICETVIWRVFYFCKSTFKKSFLSSPQMRSYGKV